MELMATCLEKLLKKSRQPIPEDFLGKVTVAVSFRDAIQLTRFKETDFSVNIFFREHTIFCIKTSIKFKYLFFVWGFFSYFNDFFFRL